MNNRRTHIEVIADILRLGEAGKTEIMYSANMSYRQLQKYLYFLVQREFIEVELSNPVVQYKVTKKGLRLLKNIDSILEMLTWRGDAYGKNDMMTVAQSKKEETTRCLE